MAERVLTSKRAELPGTQSKFSAPHAETLCERSPLPAWIRQYFEVSEN